MLYLQRTKNSSLYILCMFVVLNLILFFTLPHFIYSNGVIEPWFNFKGLVFYKDIASFHFPLGRWILIPIYNLMGWDLEAGPVTGLLVNLLSLWILYVFFKSNIKRIALVASSTFLTIFYWYFTTSGIMFYHEMLIGIFLLGSFALTLKQYTENKLNKAVLFFIGLLLSFAELSGQIASFTILINTLFLLYFVRTKTKSIKQLTKYFIWVILGVTIPFVFLLLYFWSKDALKDLYYWNFYYYSVYANYPKESFTVIKDNWKDITAFYLPTAGLLYLLNGSKDKILTLWILLFVLSSIPFILFSAYHPHHYSYFLPTLSLIVGLIIYYSKLWNRNKFLILAVGLFYVFYIFTSLAPWYVAKYNLRIMYPGVVNDLKSNDPMYSAVEWIKNNTPSETKILVIGDTLFYFRSDRLPANSRSQGVPLMYDPLEDTKKEIKEKPPEYWIIDRQFIQTRVIDAYQRYDVLDFIENELYCYKLLQTFGGWQIWKRFC